MLLVLSLMAASGSLFKVTETVSCGLAELTCRTGHCVPVDAYCNGNDDCGDGSDEPALCTPCNRTYHGQEGRTYRVQYVYGNIHTTFNSLMTSHFTANTGLLDDAHYLN